MTMPKQYMGERNHLFPFLMKKFKPIDIEFNFSIGIYVSPPKKFIHFKYIYILKGNEFEGVISLKFIQFYKTFVS